MFGIWMNRNYSENGTRKCTVLDHVVCKKLISHWTYFARPGTLYRWTQFYHGCIMILLSHHQLRWLSCRVGIVYKFLVYDSAWLGLSCHRGGAREEAKEENIPSRDFNRYSFSLVFISGLVGLQHGRRLIEDQYIGRDHYFEPFLSASGLMSNQREHSGNV